MLLKEEVMSVRRSGMGCVVPWGTFLMTLVRFGFPKGMGLLEALQTCVSEQGVTDTINTVNLRMMHDAQMRSNPRIRLGFLNLGGCPKDYSGCIFPRKSQDMSSPVIGSGREPFTELDMLSAAIWPVCMKPAFTEEAAVSHGGHFGSMARKGEALYKNKAGGI